MDKFTIHLDKTRQPSEVDRTKALTWEDICAALNWTGIVKLYESLVSIEISEEGITAKMAIIKDDENPAP
jgi:hypothetical protein